MNMLVDVMAPFHFVDRLFVLDGSGGPLKVIKKKQKHLAFPFFTFFGHYVNPKYLKLMGRWETYLGFHRFPASFSTGSLLTKSGWYFFVFKYIYICGCIYQLPSPIYKMVFQIFYKMEVPDSGIWSCSHIKWCWVYKQVSFYKMECPDGKKKNIKSDL